MLKCVKQIQRNIEKIYQNSGHFIFRRGEYIDCITNNQLKYWTIQLGANRASGAYIGVCLPKDCPTQPIAAIANNISKKYNSTISVLGIADGQFSVDSDWTTYAVFAIIISIIALTIIASSLNRSENKSKLLKSFCFQDNFKNLLLPINSDLSIFNGIRSLSMMYVVFSHTFSFYLSGGAVNMITLSDTLMKPFFLVIQAGLFAVDIFFALAGFFLAYVFIRQKSTSILKYPIAIMQRAFRIWPAYILTMLFYASIFVHLGQGPMWQAVYEGGTNQCSGMWRQILFISNIVNNGKVMCLGWGWYLQVDFQLFLASLLLLYFYQKNKMSSYLFGFCFCVGSLIFNFLYSVNLGQKILTDLDSFKTFGDYMLDLYIKPWGRCTPYFMGLFLGIFYTNYIKNKNKEYFQNSIFHKLKLHFEVSRIKRIVCELFGFCLLCFLTFLPRSIQNGSDWPLWAHALYWTFSKPIFILGMILIVLPTIIGVKNSFFCTILNNKLFSFIAKISFCTYLVHLMVVYQYIFSRFADNYYSITNVFVTELGILVISLFFGFLLTILVQLPFANLQKSFISSISQKPKQTDKINASEDLSLNINKSIEGGEI